MKTTKNKFTIIGIVLSTVLLAGIAIFTAVRLYQTRETNVAPNAPESQPEAAGQACGGPADPPCPSGSECVFKAYIQTVGFDQGPAGVCMPTNKDVVPPTSNTCNLSFTLQVSTPTPTPTPTKSPTPKPTKTPTPTPTPTPVPQCNTVCSSSNQCPSGLTCYKPNGATSGNCRNASCTTAENCLCPEPTPTPTPKPTNTPAPTPTATPNPQCNNSCTSNSQCPSSMICYIPNGSTSGNCRNTQCLGEADCLCPVATTAPTPAPTQPSLPVVGTNWPTILGTGFGILVIVGSLLLAL